MVNGVDTAKEVPQKILVADVTLVELDVGVQVGGAPLGGRAA